MTVFPVVVAVLVIAVPGMGTGAAGADERVKFGGEHLQARLEAAYARAVDVKPLRAGDGDQVRIWYADPMSRKATGYLVTREAALRCTLTFDYEDKMVDGEPVELKAIIVHQGQCTSRPEHEGRIEDALRHLPEAIGFNDQEFDCGMEDGWDAYVSGFVNAQRFSFYAANTNHCGEQRIKQVDAWLDVIAGAYGPKE